MSFTGFLSFMSLFEAFKPRDYRGWEQERDGKTAKKKLNDGLGAYDELEGETYKKSNPKVVELRKDADGLLFSWPHLAARWDETETPVAKKAVEAVKDEIDTLEQLHDTISKDVSGTRNEADEKLLKSVKDDIAGLRSAWDEAVEEIDNRANLEPGHLTGQRKSDLFQGWNPDSDKFEYQSLEEWTNIKRRAGTSKPSKDNSKQMRELESSVFVQDQASFVKSMVRLKEERATTEKLRAGMTDRANERVTGGDEVVKKGVEKHCNMAEKLTGLLAPSDGFDPKILFQNGGLLSRIVGDAKNQGGFPKKPVLEEKDGKMVPVFEQKDGKQVPKEVNPDPQEVIDAITGAATRLKDGKGEKDDANKVTQFIAAFVDGLTEANEPQVKKIKKIGIDGNVEKDKDGKDIEEVVNDENGNPVLLQSTAAKQFDLIWPKFKDAFNLTDDDKIKLLSRVDGYKKLAGGISDTISGKGSRKGMTRQGMMPENEEWGVRDKEALIKGDISGSMHSQLLAHELSEGLMSETPTIKDETDSIRLVDKRLINTRALDSLLMTAGGTTGSGDSVFHTAYEMINGMQAITGCPEVSQKQATEIMIMLRDGKTTFTDAMEKIFPDVELPWLDQN